MDQCMVDAASGEAFVDKTPATSRDLLAKMAQNAQQFSNIMSSPPTNSVNEVQASTMDQ